MLTIQESGLAVSSKLIFLLLIKCDFLLVIFLLKKAFCSFITTNQKKHGSKSSF